MTINELAAALRRPQAYPFDVDRIEVRQTHISLLFFAADRVYKIKKPLDLGFLDFSTLERRRFFCEEEVRLNRRLAPDTYLGVASVVRDSDGHMRIHPADAASSRGAEEIIEYAVEMRRLPADRMLDHLLDHGAVDNAVLDRLVDVLVEFHRTAPTGEGVDEFGAPEAVAKTVLDNLTHIEPFAGPLRGGEPGSITTLSSALHRHLVASTQMLMEKHRALFIQRVGQGRIRDGHGDLHAGNICLTDDGIIIYDCIEFAPHLRCGDTIKDLAFLIMDFDADGFRGFGAYLGRCYAKRTRDREFDTLLPFYKTHLACVRGKVNSISAADEGLEPAARDEARRAALHYFHLAASYVLPPSMILLCGLPGSGKSWAARHLARPFEATLIRSDAVRKRLAGVPPTHRATGAEAESLYSDQSSRRTFAAMLEETERRLGEGRTVVLDATFAQRRVREPFIEMARSAGVPFVVVHVTCPEPVIAERMRDRAGDAEEVSDADWSIYEQFKPNFEPPDEVQPPHCVNADSTDEAELMVSDAIDGLIGVEATKRSRHVGTGSATKR